MFLKKLYLLVIPFLICSVIFSSTFCVRITFANTDVEYESKKLPTIIIDAGHGGFDGGASTADNYPEKNINLSISLYLNDFLNVFGFETKLTRSKDTSLEDEGLNTIRQKKTSDIHNRIKLTEETENSVLISIHQNHFSDSRYSGMQVFYSRNFSDVSSGIAQCIQESTVSLLQNNNTRLIKECGTSVFLIYNAKVPSCLVECGFLSNYEESQNLKNADYQKKIAYCIAIGIMNYYKG